MKPGGFKRWKDIWQEATGETVVGLDAFTRLVDFFVKSARQFRSERHIRPGRVLTDKEYEEFLLYFEAKAKEYGKSGEESA